MKKLSAVVMAVFLILSTSLPVFAGSITERGEAGRVQGHQSFSGGHFPPWYLPPRP